ncbi:endoplasmic reticulum-Golgi intermediate compartment protein 1 isoform X2 [Marmota marmota marmota]|uniref:endoplasmic reticulum-Golgi intermediate compartment protein 1 isoform X2 n=1 Tax=Marmota marmota marmota TaxID=9994 RepID=UPI0020932EB7|nr:endoplasmic reticulum-Golgi intermediate compartment protein 1 isoform X2 [Marmota marmota marmota]
MVKRIPGRSGGHKGPEVPGNFHVSTHSATAQPQNPDMTHIIHKLSFGDTLQVQNVHGAFNALGGADRLNSNPLASHDYILKIVPTVYEDKNGKQRYSYQYTVANKEYVAYSHTGRIIPAIWFRYDLSPITVKYTERRQPLYRFITTMMLAMCCTISAEAQRMQRRIQGHPEKKTLSTEAGWLPCFRSVPSLVGPSLWRASWTPASSQPPRPGRRSSWARCIDTFQGPREAARPAPSPWLLRPSPDPVWLPPSLRVGGGEARVARGPAATSFPVFHFR